MAQTHGAGDHFMLKRGESFCIMTDYGAAYLRAHPDKLVTSLRMMGTNAWRGKLDRDVELHMTARVTFRDRSEPLTLYGRCFEYAEKPGLLECNFEMGYCRDGLGQRIELRPSAKGIRGKAAADWRVIRENREPDGPYGRPARGDEIFLLEKHPFEVCGASGDEWGPGGPTRALEEKLP